MKKNILTIVLTLIFTVNCSISQTMPDLLPAQTKDTVGKVSGEAFVFNSDTLFELYERAGAFSPKDRAKSILKRLEDISAEPDFDPDSLYLAQTENSADLMYEDKVILSVMGKDTVYTGKSRAETAQNYLGLLRESLKRHQKSKELLVILKDIGLSALLIIIAYFVFKYLAMLFSFSVRSVQNSKSRLFKGISLKNLRLLNPDQMLLITILFIRVIKFFVYALVFYLALLLQFSILPWTRHFAGKLLDFILNPLNMMIDSFLGYLPNLITIIVIFTVTRYLVRFIRFLSVSIEKGDLNLSRFHPEWAQPTFYILRILVYALMFVAIFPYLPGSNSPVFQGVSAFLAILFSISSAGSLSNIIAGIVLIYMRSFKVGDRVKIGDVAGDITGKSLLLTKIRTIKNEEVSIPNSLILGQHTINYSALASEEGLVIHTSVTIGYDIPWESIHKLLIEAAGRTEFIEKEPVPFVLQKSLDDFYVNYEINAFTRDANKQAYIYSELHKNIQDAFGAAGVEIMSPHYHALRDGNTTAIPEQKLNMPKKSSIFNIKTKPG